MSAAKMTPMQLRAMKQRRNSILTAAVAFTAVTGVYYYTMYAMSGAAAAAAAASSHTTKSRGLAQQLLRRLPPGCLTPDHVCSS